MSKNTPQQLHLSDKPHKPVLLERVLGVLGPKKGDTYLDLTAGYGGHAEAVIRAIGNADLATLVDRDEQAIAALQRFRNDGATILHADFAAAAERLAADGKAFDIILIDLGVSSPQLDKRERGFSFKQEGPLDMRMDKRQLKSAADIVNTYPEAELKRVIHTLGEEPPGQAARYAAAIIQARPLETTEDLASAVLSAHRGPRSKIHPATRTFQAIRIEVNDELGQIARLLPLLPRLLKPGGRVAVISFHSLEDRLVKRYFAEQAGAGYESQLFQITKKPVSGADEDVHNPRARSAKLRAAVKIKNEGT
jgi:16S rRNA (cytosine1402-N4)-methyltransferase